MAKDPLNTTPPPRIGITLGDAAGIGPELVLRALNNRELRAEVRPVVYGSAELLQRISTASGIAWPEALKLQSPENPIECNDPSVAILVDSPTPDSLVPGKPQAICGRLAANWIKAAVRDALAKRLDAIVTAPICKAALHAAGMDYPGHTEMLADLTGCRDASMFFWSPRLAVGLVTIHEAISNIPPLISRERVLVTIRRVAAAMRTAQCPCPRIGVIGLNPHAGENGLFGDEESRCIAPAIAAARGEGILASGPLVPDTVFCALETKPYDAYVAMYHDQGLIPFKLLSFDEGVNITLGLPLIRTSPDHGTAFDLAWQGKASPSSLLAALRRARDMALTPPA